MRTPELTHFQGRLLLLSVPALSRNVDVAVGGGGGAGLESAITVIGASIGGPYLSKHQWQLDYLFHQSHSRDDTQGHHLTVSYIRQARSGRARGFLQAGDGLVTYRNLDWYPGPPGSPVPNSKSSVNFAMLWGGGVTIDAGRSFFTRPEIRIYTETIMGTSGHSERGTEFLTPSEPPAADPASP